jgi:outer membrane protein assembly factor BamB
MALSRIRFYSYRWIGLLALLLFICAAARADSNWPRWRGPTDSGSTSEGSYPSSLEKSQLVWKTALPGKGSSTPIVWDKIIYVTAPTNGLDSLLAFNWSGEPLSVTTFGRENPGSHRHGTGSNASPNTDGKGVFVYFKSGTLAAVNLQGTILWQTNLVQAFGPDTLMWDQGTSPVLTESLVIMVRMQHDDSWIAAFNKTTGKLEWKVPRKFETPEENDHAYTSPLILQYQAKPALLIWGAEHLTLNELTRGEQIWVCGDFNPGRKEHWPAVASPVVVAGTAVVPAGRSDHGQPRLDGIRIEPRGADEPSGKRLWTRLDTGTYVPTPAVYNGRVYLLRDRGEIECIDPSDGKTVWKDALPKSSGNFYASPVIADGKLYAVREDGTVFVVSVEGKFQLVSESKLEEPVIASPVPVGGRMLVRGENHVFSFAETKTAGVK